MWALFFTQKKAKKIRTCGEMPLWNVLTPYEVPFYYCRYPNSPRTKKGSENVLKSFKKSC